MRLDADVDIDALVRQKILIFPNKKLAKSTCYRLICCCLFFLLVVVVLFFQAAATPGYVGADLQVIYNANTSIL